MDAVEIFPPDGPINATVRPPGSKSITNRALPIAAVAKGTSTLTGVLKSDDTIYMIQALKHLGVEIDDSRLSDIPEESIVVVHGCDGRFPATEADLFLGNSGTSIRFLTAMVAAAGRGTYRLDGIERMRQRPIGDLVDALRRAGVDYIYEGRQGYPPVQITADDVNLETIDEMDGETSSQFISAVMMAMPASRLANGGSIFVNNAVSRPYLELTAAIMRSADIEVEIHDCKVEPLDKVGLHVKVGEGRYFHKRSTSEIANLDIEADASASSYWIASAALAGRVHVAGLSTNSLQGDIQFFRALERRMTQPEFTWYSDFSGMLFARGCELEMGNISDTAQTMAAVAVFADSPTTITGVEHMRHKECDRVSAVVTELRKLGIECDEHQDGYTIYPGTPVCNEPIETYDDHRMAMSFALLGLKVPGIIIKDPDCVNKTYPRFWDDWEKVTGKAVRRFTL